MLETMIALLIMAMMGLMLSSGLGTAIRSFGRDADLQTEIRQAIARRDARGWLENVLADAAPDDVRPLFEGAPDRLAFLAVLPTSRFWPGEAAQVEISANGMLTVSGRYSKNGETSRTSSNLAPERIRLSLQYWGSPAHGQEAAWQDRWSASQGLPDLVQIRFHGAGVRLPPLTVRPRKAELQSEMSRSSLLPPARPSRP
ncbi:hypothetical protein [Gemmobacter nectariphilus]|uniref:hypothetical protein n=1 Tax=Gemmobacter nectariphilus TaxID=220343 RepID=UPI0012B5C102|nr:hypothetical protein [Gemmobacter nectariphilus]